jgi:hypothetical protein
MSTVIAVTGADLALPAVDRYTPAALMLRAPAEQPLEQALAETSAVLEAVGHLVVLVPASLPQDHRLRLHSVRSLLESDRIALVEVDLPPLALALLAVQLRQISQYDLGPGVVASAPWLLTHYLYAGAVLGSVAKLDRVAVGFRSHLKSWVPGVQFAVLANPKPYLVEVSDATRLPGPGFPTHLAVAAAPTADGEWVRGRLGRDWNCQYLREVRLPADSARWWGTAKLAEFAAYIPDVGVLYQLVSCARREQCRWCGRERAGGRCGFCEAAAQEPELENHARAVGVTQPESEAHHRAG